MSSPFDDYRQLMARSLTAASEQVFGNAEAIQAAQRQRNELAAYWDRPLSYVRDVLGQTTIPISRGILRALKTKRRVHTSGCRKSTKSHTSGQAVNWFFDSGPCRIVITSATHMQVRENLFARIRHLRMHAKRPLPGRLGVTSLRMPDDPTWYAIGISTNKPGHIQGIHADVTLDPMLEYDEEWIDEESLLPPDPELFEEDERRKELDAGEVIDREVWSAKREGARLLFVLDEMAEMRADIVETMAGSWMGDSVYVLSQFNPTFAPDSNHPAARFLKADSGFHRIHIAGREPPPEMHLAGMFDQCFHGVPKSLMSDEWVERQLRSWGPQSALACCHIYGLPATLDREWQFLPMRILKLGFGRQIKDSGRSSDRHIGWDVAASANGDFNVVSLSICGVLEAQERWHCPDPIESAERVLALRLEWAGSDGPIPGRNIHVDKTGVGEGPVAYMRRKGVPVDAVDFGAAAVGDWIRITGEMVFANRKTELIWVARMLWVEGLIAVDPAFAALLAQAQWHTYEHVPRNTGTALKVRESKEDMREEHGQSPDEFDSFLLTISRNSQEIVFQTVSDLEQLWRMYG